MNQNNYIKEKNELITLFFCSFGIVVLLEWIQKGNPTLVGEWIIKSPSAYILNSFLVFSFLCIFFLFQKRWGFIFLATSLLFVLSIVNSVKLHFKNDVFAFQDFYLVTKINGIISQYLTTTTMFWIGFSVALLVVICYFIFKKTPKLNRNYHFSLIALLFLGGFPVLSFGFDITPDRSQPVNSYQENGFFYSFVESASHIKQDQPSGYSRQNIEGIVKSLHSPLKETAPNTNVIFVQLESFFDPTILNNVSFSEDPIPNFHRIASQYPSGNVTVPVYGGTTVNSEFEVLTSFDMMHYTNNTVPYAQFLGSKKVDALPFYFRSLGYNTTAIHNHNQTFFNRHKVYKNLGFDVYMGKESFIRKETNALGWMKDELLVEMIMDTLKRTKKNDFIFSVTVQSHGKYPEEYLYDTDNKQDKIDVTSDLLSEEEKNITSNYLHELRETDKMIGSLVSQLTNHNEPTIVVFYGDHLPNLGNQGSVYTKLGLTEAQKYETPYAIWSNAPLDMPNQNLDTTNLALPVLDQLNLSGPLLFQVTKQYEGTPDYFNIKDLLQYDLLFGENFSYKDDQFPYETKDILYTLLPTSISYLQKGVQGYKVVGEYFIQGMNVEVEGKSVPYEWLNERELIIIPDNPIEIDDEIHISIQDDQNNDVMSFYYFATEDDVQ